MHTQVHEQKIICEQCGCQFANQDDLSLHVTKEHAVVIVCDECPFTTSSVCDMENHVDQKHRVKELFACYQCDFDSEDKNELEIHNVKNVHNIRIHNPTIKET